MENERFDDMARLLARVTTRRAAVGMALAAAIGGSGAAEARICRAAGASCTARTVCCNGTCPTGNAVPRGQRNRCPCSAGLTWCSSVCLDLTTTSNCGSCGNQCPAGIPCTDGSCCIATGNTCTNDGDCCSGICETASGTCKAALLDIGATCLASDDCVSGHCEGGLCCVGTGELSSTEALCCSGSGTQVWVFYACS